MSDNDNNDNPTQIEWKKYITYIYRCVTAISLDSKSISDIVSRRISRATFFNKGIHFFIHIYIG